jgi:hypothetical protein
MTDQPTSETSGGAPDAAKREPLWRRRPRWSVIGGIVIGAAFTFGYLVNSFFYCSAQFSCSVSPFWLIVIALIGTGIGALWGWLIGKFFRSMYRIMRVD